MSRSLSYHTSVGSPMRKTAHRFLSVALQRSQFVLRILRERRRLLEAWAEIHRAELQHDWELLQSGQPPRQDRATQVSPMVHAIHRVTAFSVVGPYTLVVTFKDGSEQRIDFEPVLRGALFGPLRDPATFERVALDPEAGTLVWPNGADFDPATLHDWPDCGTSLSAELAAGPIRDCIGRVTTGWNRRVADC